MLVIFKRNFYAGGGVMYSASPSPQEIPDALSERLPKTAKIVESTAKAEAPKPSATTKPKG